MPAAKREPGKREAPLSIRIKPEQREKLERAAKNANVSLGYYLLESALMVADEELSAGVKIEGWTPRSARASSTPTHLAAPPAEPQRPATKARRTRGIAGT